MRVSFETFYSDETLKCVVLASLTGRSFPSVCCFLFYTPKKYSKTRYVTVLTRVVLFMLKLAAQLLQEGSDFCIFAAGFTESIAEWDLICAAALK